jgi:hypothetical protein
MVAPSLLSQGCCLFIYTDVQNSESRYVLSVRSLAAAAPSAEAERQKGQHMPTKASASGNGTMAYSVWRRAAE